MNKINKNSCSGFTLVEMLLSISVIAMISSIAIPAYMSYQTRNDLEVATNTLVQTLRRAQVLAQGVDQDSNWGVSFQSGSIVLFKGATYATRDTNFDEVYEFSSNIFSSGLSEIDYAKFTGIPQSTGSIILTNQNNISRTVTVNSKGMVDY